MNMPIDFDLDAIEAAAKAATPGPWASNHSIVFSMEHGVIADRRISKKVDAVHMATANPAVVLELVRRLRAAEALAASRIKHVPKQARTVLVFADIDPDHRAEAEGFSEAIKKRCTSYDSTLVAFFPACADVKAYDEEQLRKIGFMRLPSGRAPDVQLKSTLDDGRAPAVVARERGWGPGTRIVGNEGPGPEVIEITAVGEYELLAKTISRNGEPVSAEDFGEESWTLDCRDWQEVPS